MPRFIYKSFVVSGPHRFYFYFHVMQKGLASVSRGSPCLAVHLPSGLLPLVSVCYLFSSLLTLVGFFRFLIFHSNPTLPFSPLLLLPVLHFSSLLHFFLFFPSPFRLPFPSLSFLSFPSLPFPTPPLLSCLLSSLLCSALFCSPFFSSSLLHYSAPLSSLLCSPSLLASLLSSLLCSPPPFSLLPSPPLSSAPLPAPLLLSLALSSEAASGKVAAWKCPCVRVGSRVTSRRRRRKGSLETDSWGNRVNSCEMKYRLKLKKTINQEKKCGGH